jgi:hypothetical protein
MMHFEMLEFAIAVEYPTRKTGSHPRRRVAIRHIVLWLVPCLLALGIVLFRQPSDSNHFIVGQIKSTAAYSSPIMQDDCRSDSVIIRNAVEELLFSDGHDGLGGYLEYLGDSGSYLVADVLNQMSDIEVHFGTLESLVCDIIAGMVLALGGENDGETHRAVVRALNRSGLDPKGYSLSAVLRSMGDMTGGIDSERDALRVLDNVREALSSSRTAHIRLP